MLSTSTDEHQRQRESHSMMSSSDVLSLEQVTRQYSRSQAPAVCRIALALHDGELLGLLGPSGCGKTTLLRLIAGFERPQSGTIRLGTQVVAGDTWIPPEKRGIGMVFQDYALFPHLTVGQNVAFGLRQVNHCLQGRSLTIRQRVHDILDLVGLGGLEKRFPHQLSGGQQQRVALARALAPFPQMVLLDEPLSNLDAKVRLQLRQEVRDIIKLAGASGIFVTHDQEEALSICDRVAVMRAGHIEQIGTPEALYQVPASRFVAEFVTQANFVAARWQEGILLTDWCDVPLTRTDMQMRYETDPANPCEQGGYAPIAAAQTGRSWAEMQTPSTVMSKAEHEPLDEQSEPSSGLDVMIRQEDVQIQPNEAGDVVIRDRQFLGRENRYTLQAPTGKLLIARTGAQVMLPVGTAVSVAIAPEALRLFPTHQSSHSGPR